MATRKKATTANRTADIRTLLVELREEIRLLKQQLADAQVKIQQLSMELLLERDRTTIKPTTPWPWPDPLPWVPTPDPFWPPRNDRCSKCGLELAGVMMYVCSAFDCPVGLGPVTCSAEQKFTLRG